MIKEGDSGHEFFVIVEGTADVERGGKKIAKLGPGDFFGEIALLRDVPRTATVRAVSPSELFALDRDDFLAALTHSAVRAAGESVAEERLAVTAPQ